MIIDTSVDPGVPISREATLVQGITDADVRGKPGVHRPMIMCAMKTYAGFRSEMNPATGEHAWASLAQIELFVDPDQQGNTHRQERHLTGLLEALPSEVNREVEADALAREVLSASGIEGEILGPDQVRSCVAARLGLDAGKSLRPIPAVEGIVRIMVDATARYWEGLTEERLLGWHSWLFPQGRNGLRRVRAGAWRTGPVQVVSGPVGRNGSTSRARSRSGSRARCAPSSSGSTAPPETDGVIRAATAHLWFSAVHPFEDGNGRIARALTDMALARSNRAPRVSTACLTGYSGRGTRTTAHWRTPPWRPRGPATPPPGSAGSLGASAGPWTTPWRRCVPRGKTPS